MAESFNTVASVLLYYYKMNASYFEDGGLIGQCFTDGSNVSCGLFFDGLLLRLTYWVGSSHLTATSAGTDSPSFMAVLSFTSCHHPSAQSEPSRHRSRTLLHCVLCALLQ